MFIFFALWIISMTIGFVFFPGDAVSNLITIVVTFMGSLITTVVILAFRDSGGGGSGGGSGGGGCGGVAGCGGGGCGGGCGGG